MRESEVTVVLNSKMEQVFEVMTNNTDTTWRSDIVSVDIKDSTTFVENYPNGNSTTFHITKQHKNNQYEFDMENKLFTGHWSGNLKETLEGKTELTLKETLHIKNKVILILSYIIMNLKKMQMNYVKDLKKKLNESGRDRLC